MTYLNHTDEQLIEEVVKQDQDAFSVLYTRHSSLVLGVVFKIVNERGLAEEILQETFWRVWKKADTFDPSKAKFTTWLYSIARRLAIDTYRKQKVRPQTAQSEQAVLLMESAASADRAVIDQVDLNFDSSRARQALNALSPEQRTVLEMAYFQGKTRREIAKELDIPLGTIHTRARLALQYLRQSLMVFIPTIFVLADYL